MVSLFLMMNAVKLYNTVLIPYIGLGLPRGVVTGAVKG